MGDDRATGSGVFDCRPQSLDSQCLRHGIRRSPNSRHACSQGTLRAGLWGSDTPSWAILSLGLKLRQLTRSISMRSLRIEAGGYLTEVCDITKVKAGFRMPSSWTSDNLPKKRSLVLYQQDCQRGLELNDIPS